MSMTSEGMRPRRPLKVASLRSNLGMRFADLMQAAGVLVPKGVSMTCLALLRDVVAQGGTLGAAQSRCSKRASDMKEPAPGMGLLIKHGYARFVPAVKHYEVTAEGRDLLASAEAKGVMATLAEFEQRLREAARAAAGGEATQGGNDT